MLANFFRKHFIQRDYQVRISRKPAQGLTALQSEVPKPHYSYKFLTESMINLRHTKF